MGKRPKHISLASHVLDFLGRKLIATPEALGFVDGDGDTFYLARGDRGIDRSNDPKAMQRGILIAVYQRLLFWRVSVFASILAFVLTVVGLVALSAIQRVSQVAQAALTIDEPIVPATCAGGPGSAIERSMTPEQVAEWRARCVRMDQQNLMKMQGRSQ